MASKPDRAWPIMLIIAGLWNIGYRIYRNEWTSFEIISFILGIVILIAGIRMLRSGA
jgi:hypothetical protein